MSADTPTHPVTATREEWLCARRELLAAEKELTRARENLAARRRRLPMVEITADYTFEGMSGQVSLFELFAGHRQLIVYHFMFDSDWDEGCPSCSLVADSFGDNPSHLAARDTAFAVISRASLAKIEAFRARMGWTFRWYSSADSRFNDDFAVTVDAADPNSTYNYVPTTDQLAAGAIWVERGELPGLSVFYRDQQRIFHTYSTYSRGLDHLMNIYNYLDLTPLGRGADDLTPYPMAWVRHHDRYPNPV